LRRLVRRAEFLAAARGRRWTTPGCIVQTIAASVDDGSIGLGLTASRKVGGAVVRNRARRRLRALGRELLPRLGRPGHDYVLVARATTASRDFAALRADLETALDKLAAGPR
jgi:ribonuclease P protein component